MKLFHYPAGYVAIETMTVGELIAELQKYPADMPILPEYEDVTGEITTASFVVKKHNSGQAIETCDCLFIDVERY